MRLIVLGTVVDTQNMSDTLDRLVELVADGRAHGRSHQIATINADFLVHAANDPQVQQILLSASHATADGMPLVWGSRLLGVPVAERVTGADLVPELATVAAREGISFYFLGAAEGVAQKAADMLVQENPGLRIAGVHAPTIEEVSTRDPSIAQRIRDANPDVLFVAFGAPKQDKWIAEHLEQLGVPVNIGVGGTFDFITGRTTRAPMWIRRAGLEWLHRLCSEPRRLWRRYFSDITYFPGAFVRQWKAVRYSGPADLDVDVQQKGFGFSVKPRGVIVEATADAFREATKDVCGGEELTIDASELEHVDSVGLAALVDLAVAVRNAGGYLVLSESRPAVLDAIEATSLSSFFSTCAQPREQEIPPPVALGQNA